MQKKYEQLVQDILSEGYGICDDFLSLEEVYSLLATFRQRYDKGLFAAAKTGKLDEVSLNYKVRGDEILWLEKGSVDAAELMLMDKTNGLIKYLNETCYLGIKGSEIHFAKYGPGKFYKRHKDAFQNQSGRILSIIYYLNVEWIPEHEGNLIIYKSADNVENAISISPLAGRMVCFESEKLDHEVTTTKVDRYSVTGWFLTRDHIVT
jgi:SM-20-related protein